MFAPNRWICWQTLNQYSLVKEKSNVIIRNLGVKKVLAENGDAIGIREDHITVLVKQQTLTFLRIVYQCVG
jgi:pectate lyase